MIELDQARELLKKAVATQGKDFVYNPHGERACYYRPISPDRREGENDPRHLTGCLVGVALSLAGETRHADHQGSVRGLRSDYPDMLSEEATDYLHVAQGAQDRGRTWGEAYAAAERTVPQAF